MNTWVTDNIPLAGGVFRSSSSTFIATTG